MTYDHDELRSRFAHLREYDQATAPQFRVAPQRRIARAWFAAAALVVVASGVVLRQTLNQHERTGEPSVTITTWRSPTAGLLPPATQLTNPAILSSVLDNATTSYVRKTGELQ